MTLDPDVVPPPAQGMRSMTPAEFAEFEWQMRNAPSMADCRGGRFLTPASMGRDLMAILRGAPDASSVKASR